MLMLNSFFMSAVVGTLLGFLAGLGVGGGSLLVLWLTFIAGFPQQTARSINLMFYIPAALIASLIHRKKGRVNIRQLLPAIISGTAAAIIATILGHHISTDLLRKLMGILFLVVGLREVFYRPRKAK